MTSAELAEYLRVRRSAVERALERSLKAYPGQTQAIFQAMHSGLSSGGARIRPILTLAAGEMFGAKQKDLLPFACAVEMIHVYSLIHAGLPVAEGHRLSSGKAADRGRFSSEMVSLAADSLLAESFHLVSGPHVLRALPAEMVLQLVHELSHAAGIAGLLGGQALDLEADYKNMDVATMEYIHVRKTGALILAALRIGAQIAGVKAADLRRLSKFGGYLGLAFQIAEDIAKSLGDGRHGGAVELVRKDLQKATYVSVVGIVQATERLQELLGQSRRELMPYGDKAEPLGAIAEHVVAQATQKKQTAEREMKR